MLCSATSHTGILQFSLQGTGSTYLFQLWKVHDRFNPFSLDLFPSRFPQVGSYLLLDAITFPFHHLQAEVTAFGGYFKCLSQEFLQLDSDPQSQSQRGVQSFLQYLSSAAADVCISAFSFSSCQAAGAGLFSKS